MYQFQISAMPTGGLAPWGSRVLQTEYGGTKLSAAATITKFVSSIYPCYVSFWYLTSDVTKFMQDFSVSVFC